MNPKPTRPRHPGSAARDAPAQLASRCNRLAFDLYAHLRQHPGNLVFSPPAVALSLALAAAGAAGRTRSTLARVLRWPEDLRGLGPAARALRLAWRRGPRPGESALELDSRLWVQPGSPVRAAFQHHCRQLGADVVALDFRRDPEGARGAMSAWLGRSGAGRGLAPLPAGSVGPLAGRVLGSAAWLRGAWGPPLGAGAVRPGIFHVSRAVARSVPLRWAAGRLRTARFELGRAVEAPLREGGTSALLLLPDEVDGVGELERRLSPESLARWAGALTEGPLELALPRVELAARYALREGLSAMGARAAFQPGTADFSGVDASPGAPLENLWHAAGLCLGGEPSGAGAASAAPPGRAARPEPGPRAADAARASRGPAAARLAADHPFLLLVRHAATGAILFVARVAEPEALPPGTRSG
ncbi:MAG TPA: serpin family protein [Candidatus Saccharimonadales bacterium]|nr:serpin family protein [Candidatus Saccharimonadales bacterium]